MCVAAWMVMVICCARCPFMVSGLWCSVMEASPGWVNATTNALYVPGVVVSIEMSPAAMSVGMTVNGLAAKKWQAWAGVALSVTQPSGYCTVYPLVWLVQDWSAAARMVVAGAAVVLTFGCVSVTVAARGADAV